MASTVGRLGFLVGANTNAFDKALVGVQRRIDRFKKQGVGGLARRLGGFARSMAGTTAAVAGVGGVLAGGTAAAMAFRRGADFEVVEKSFRSLAKTIGSDGPRFLQLLREATNGTVGDYELMLAANNAMLLGVAKSDRDFATLARQALRLGQAMGRGPVDALNDIVVGIGRQSRLILDNLGIMVSVEKANEAYARSIGKATDELTDAEQKAAFYQATLEAVNTSAGKLPDSMDDAKGSLGRLGAQMLNLIDRAMQPVLDFVIPWVDRLNKAFGGLDASEVADGILTGFQGVAQVIARIIDTSQGLRVIWNGITITISAALSGIASLLGAIVRGTSRLAQFAGLSGFDEAADAIDRYAKEKWQNVRADARDIAEAWDSYTGQKAQRELERWMARLERESALQEKARALSERRFEELSAGDRRFLAQRQGSVGAADLTEAVRAVMQRSVRENVLSPQLSFADADMRRIGNALRLFAEQTDETLRRQFANLQARRADGSFGVVSDIAELRRFRFEDIVRRAGLQEFGDLDELRRTFLDETNSIRGDLQFFTQTPAVEDLQARGAESQRELTQIRESSRRQETLLQEIRDRTGGSEVPRAR